MVYRLYLQKEAIGDGAVGSLTDVLSTFGYRLLSIPYDGGGKVKEMPSHDYHDEHGLEILNTEEELKLESYDITLQLGYKDSDALSALTSLRLFRDYLLGVGGIGRSMLMYNDYTCIGRGSVLLKEIDPSPTFYRTSQGVRLFFNVTLTVNDPYHFYMLRNGNIVQV